MPLTESVWCLGSVMRPSYLVGHLVSRLADDVDEQRRIAADASLLVDDFADRVQHREHVRMGEAFRPDEVIVEAKDCRELANICWLAAQQRPSLIEAHRPSIDP